MKELIKFEFHKIISQKSIYFVALLLLALFFVTAPSNSENKEVHYEPYAGKVTDEKIELIESDLGPISEMVGERTAGEMVDYGVYHDFMHERAVAEAVDNRIQELENRDAPGAAMEQNMLESLKLDTFFYHGGPDQTVDFVNTFGFIIAGALILLGLFNVYANEYATGVDQYIFSAKRGRRQIIYAKLTASFLYTFLVVCAWVAFDVIYYLVKLGSSGWQSPVQFIFKYSTSPYDFTMIEYFAVQAGVHLIGALGFAALVLFISSLCSKPIVSFLVSGIIFGLPVVWMSILGLETNWLIDLSFTNIMKVEELFLTFNVYNILGLHILKPIFLVGMSMIFTIVLIYVTYYYVRYREV